MNLPDNPADLARLILAVTDLHPDNDMKTRMEPLTEALHAAGWIRWSGSPAHPGWTLDEKGAALLRSLNPDTPKGTDND